MNGLVSLPYLLFVLIVIVRVNNTPRNAIVLSAVFFRQALHGQQEYSAYVRHAVLRLAMHQLRSAYLGLALQLHVLSGGELYAPTT